MDSRKKRTLAINADEGGTTAPEGTREYQVEKPITITATPKSGYEFTGWTVIDGDVTIEIQAVQPLPSPCMVLTVLLQPISSNP